MKKNVTRTSLSLTLTLVSDTVEESKDASSLFGPVKAGLITSQGTLGAQHTELLNYCLRSLEILQSKSYVASGILSTDTPTVRALRCITAIDEDGIN